MVVKAMNSGKTSPINYESWESVANSIGIGEALLIVEYTIDEGEGGKFRYIVREPEGRFLFSSGVYSSEDKARAAANQLNIFSFHEKK